MTTPRVRATGDIERIGGRRAIRRQLGWVVVR
jgi:hypothetical protein